MEPTQDGRTDPAVTFYNLDREGLWVILFPDGRLERPDVCTYDSIASVLLDWGETCGREQNRLGAPSW